ncbi:hypothetical protein P5P86_06540 [Nocardioides sp. BP30]|uniref:DUF6912 family protein n=1 Tax=Nocardioides sp. BP30 TaxID=3036374 RepID=UPI0024686999|nr:hypothetical protein [Nocardioides sp. BP30]WGL53486.1 hypothetical protein P5P86_06540 [Nocardioides sp. BP30]
MTRIYVPATSSALAAWHAARSIPAAALAEAFEAPDDTEEGEYAALMSAADASAAMLTAPGRRFVVVVESTYAPADWADVVAVHGDVADRQPGDDTEEDLGWFATQEVPDLL